MLSSPRSRISVWLRPEPRVDVHLLPVCFSLPRSRTPKTWRAGGGTRLLELMSRTRTAQLSLSCRRQRDNITGLAQNLFKCDRVMVIPKYPGNEEAGSEYQRR